MNDVERVKEATDIVAIINEVVPLKRSGRNLKGRCPFHGEKTPSFYVSPERQVWHCFGCGKGGDVLSFFMEYEHMDFPEALRLLAQRAGISLSSTFENTRQQSIKERIYEINHLMEEYFHYVLTKHPLGQLARNYVEQRGINEKIVETFTLGYAPNSWDAQYAFLQKKGYKPEDIAQAGLIVKGSRGYYDRFRGRLMFPIHDHRGQVLAFAGRVLDPKIKEAKYINSPETPVYTKGHTVYGLDKTKDAIRREQSVIVVEGEFDFLQSYQAGNSNVVAIKGTALTEEQIRLLKRFTDTIIFALDSDVAGDDAARRGILLADQVGLSMKAVYLPQGKDPDECIRNAYTVWKKALEDAQPIYDFLLDSSLRRYDPVSVDGKRRISDEFIPILAKISNPIIQGHYIRILAEKLNLQEETISLAIRKVQKQSGVTQDRPKPQPVLPKQSREIRLEETLLAVLLQSDDPVVVDIIFSLCSAQELSHTVLQKIFHLAFEAQKQRVALPLGKSIPHVPDELVPTINTLILLPVEQYLDTDTEQKLLQQLIADHQIVGLRRKISQLTTKLQKQESGSHPDGDQELQRLSKELDILLHDLRRKQKKTLRDQV